MAQRISRRPWNLVHPFQRKYAAWVGGLLFCYSFIVFGLALLAPYIVPAIKLSSAVPLEARQSAAEQFLFLAEALWPALFGLILGSIVLTLYLTNRLAGPLYRLDKAIGGIASGDLSQRIVLRKGDELRDLAEQINASVDLFESALVEIRERSGHLEKVLRDILEWAQTQEPPHPTWLPALEAALKDSEGVEKQIESFRLSESRPASG